MLQCIFLTFLVYTFTHVDALPSADIVGINLDPPSRMAQRNNDGHFEVEPSTSLSMANDILDGPATIHKQGTQTQNNNGIRGAATSILPPAIGPLAQMAGDVLAEMVPGAETAGQSLSDFGQQVLENAGTSTFEDNGYVNALTGMPCHKMNSVLCQSTTTTTTTTLPPGIVSRRRAALREAEKADMAKYIEEVMEARRATNQQFPDTPGVTVGAPVESEHSKAEPTEPVETAVELEDRRGNAKSSNIRERHRDEARLRLRTKPSSTIGRRLQILNGLLNAANLRVNQVENAVAAATGLPPPAVTVPIVGTVVSGGLIPPPIQGAQYPAMLPATTIGVPPVLPNLQPLASAMLPATTIGVPPVLPSLQPLASAAQGSYYRQHNLAQARAAFTNAVANNAQYRHDARTNLLDATHRASLEALDAKKDALTETMALPQVPEQREQLQYSPVMQPTLMVSQQALWPQATQSSGSPTLEAQATNPVNQIRQQEADDALTQARQAAINLEQATAAFNAAQVAAASTPTARIGHQLPQGMQIGQQLPQGMQIGQQLPQGMQIGQQLPQGMQIGQQLPQGMQIGQQLPQGMQGVGFVNPQFVTSYPPPQYGYQPLQGGAGMQYANPLYRLTRTNALHPNLSVERLNGVSQNLVKYGMENDWTMFKSLSDNIAELAEVSSAAAAAAAADSKA